MTVHVRSYTRGRRKTADGTMPLLPLLQARDDAEEAERAEEEAAALVVHDRMRVHEADLSPPDMAGQSCHSVAQYIPRLQGHGVRRVLDCTAGSGSFPMAAREVWPHAHVTACEAREEEAPHLEHHANEVHMGDFFDAPVAGDYDLVITNPPFSLIPLLLARCLELVLPGGYVAFVVRMTWGDAADTDVLWHDPPVLASHEFAGRWRFRVGLNPKTGKPYGVDSVGYRLLIWQRPEPRYPVRPCGIRMVKLPLLTAESRRWRKTASGLWLKPGTEYTCTPDDPVEALPPVPWRTAA